MNNNSKSQGFDERSLNSHYSINANNLNINNIPYAKSISNSNLVNNHQIPNLNNTTKLSSIYNNELPPIPKTPINQNDKYKQAYDNCNQAKGLIQTRLNKLLYEKKVLGEMKQNLNQILNYIKNLPNFIILKKM